jgi:hypothetical protein
MPRVWYVGDVMRTCWSLNIGAKDTALTVSRVEVHVSSSNAKQYVANVHSKINSHLIFECQSLMLAEIIPSATLTTTPVNPYCWHTDYFLQHTAHHNAHNTIMHTHTHTR